MKLPDFTLDAELNRLRSAMQAAFREFTSAALANTLTADEVERLKNEGIEIPLEDVRVLNDGTHVYKGRRVSVAILPRENARNLQHPETDLCTLERG